MRRGLLTTRRKAGPVVKVDDAEIAVFINNTVASVYFYIEYVGRFLAHGFEPFHIKGIMLRLAVDSLVAVLAVSVFERIEPVEEPVPLIP